MNTASHRGIATQLDEPKTEGYFKMQIAGFLNLSMVNQDPFVNREQVPQVIGHFSSRIELRAEIDRSSLPSGALTVSKLARWFCENQFARAGPKTPP